MLRQVEARRIERVIDEVLDRWSWPQIIWGAVGVEVLALGFVETGMQNGPGSEDQVDLLVSFGRGHGIFGWEIRKFPFAKRKGVVRDSATWHVLSLVGVAHPQVLSQSVRSVH